jgi:hypothetical protein
MIVSSTAVPAVGDAEVDDVGLVERRQRRARRAVVEHVGVQAERVDPVELGHVE